MNLKCQTIFLGEAYRCNEEDLLKEAALAFVENLPLEAIKKLFNLKVIYGNTERLEEAFEKGNDNDIKLIQKLINEDSSFCVGKIYIEER